MDNDALSQCQISITLNGYTLFQGLDGFPSAIWAPAQYPIPSGVLRVGTNQLFISNQEQTGTAGNPPWFMVARAAIGGADYTLPPPELTTLQVVVPATKQPFPEPLPPNHAQPGFTFRGIKGWNWDPDQYLAAVPFLASVKMNFLMNGYLS
ncbi:MAG: hypothetical protein ACREFR_15860, partial [Limisphaerales bacterium]